MALRRAALGLVLLVTTASVGGCKKAARTVSLTSMTFGHNTYVAVGQQEHLGNVRGFALRSSDGETWGEVPMPTSGTLVMVYPAGKGFVAVGSHGVVSEDGVGGAAGSEAAAGGASGKGGKAGAGGAAGLGGAGGVAGVGGAAGTGGVGGAGGAGGGTGGNGQGGGGASGQGGTGISGASGQTSAGKSGASGQGAAAVSGASGQNEEAPGGSFEAKGGDERAGLAGPGLATEAERESRRGLVMLSEDGTVWREASNPPTVALIDVAQGATGLVAAARDSLYWSSNGEVWIREPVGSVPVEIWSAVEYGNGRFVALGPKPAVSTDGMVWRSITQIPDNELRGLRFTGNAFYSQGKVGGFFGGVGADECTLLRSTDGENWHPDDGVAAPGCIRDETLRIPTSTQGPDAGQLTALTPRGLYERESKAAVWGIRTDFDGQTPLRIEFGQRWVTATTEGVWASEDAVTWRQVFRMP